MLLQNDIPMGRLVMGVVLEAVAQMLEQVTMASKHSGH